MRWYPGIAAPPHPVRVDGCIRTWGRALLAVTVVLVVSVNPPQPIAAQEAAPSQRTYVQTQLQLSNEEFSALHSGRPMVKTLNSATTREMLTVGGIRIEGFGMTGFVDQFKTLEGFRTSQFVKQIHKFSDEPVLSDLDVLALDVEDIEALRECRVGSCDVQLSADDIRLFNTQVDWRSPDAPAQAATLYKHVLFTHLSAYRAGGLARLVRYNDREVPKSLAEETSALLAARPSLLDATVDFQYHLRDYPGNRTGNVQDFFYWSKEVFGFKPVIGLNHVSIHSEDGGGALIATTQIYASHYMDGSVAVNALLPDVGGSGFYWLYMNRSRIGRLSGLVGSLSRPIVQRRARAGLAKSLVQTKQRLEAVR